MQNRRAILYYCGFILAILSTFFHVLGLSTSHWLESYEEAGSTFDRMGLWTVCFNNFAYDIDYLGKIYDGCHWIYSYEYKPIFDWLNPGWLVLVQVLMVLALVVNVGVLFVMVMQTFFGQLLLRNKSVSVFTNSVVVFISATFVGISVSLFGLQARVSRTWLTRPDQNFLAWSYGLAVVSGFFAVFSSMCLLTDALRLRFEEKGRLKKEKGEAIFEVTVPLNPVDKKIDIHMY